MAAMAAAPARGALWLMMEGKLEQTGRLAFDYRRTRSLMSTTQDAVTGIPFCPKRLWHLMDKVLAPTAAWALRSSLWQCSARSRGDGAVAADGKPGWPACAPGRALRRRLSP